MLISSYPTSNLVVREVMCFILGSITPGTDSVFPTNSSGRGDEPELPGALLGGVSHVEVCHSHPFPAVFEVEAEVTECLK